MSRRATTMGPNAGSGLGSEVHLCDNYPNLLVAAADVVERSSSTAVTILFIDDRLPLADGLKRRLEEITGAAITRVSDAGAVDAFARLPRWMPGMMRRNVTLTSHGPIGPTRWRLPTLGDRRFDRAYVYNPGFFLSKVLAGCSDRVIMRDSGYANYVRHRVPLRRVVPRLLAGRSPIWQTWGEEPWVDAIEVVRPDQVPPRVRHKASRITLDQFLARTAPEGAAALVRAFWGESPVPNFAESSALLVTQPIDQLSMCTTSEKDAIYRDIAEHLEGLGYDVVVKPHPLEQRPALSDHPAIPRSFPIEGWTWLERAPFALAVSLNSAALADAQIRFAARRVQMIPPERFYAQFRDEWPAMIERALNTVEAAEPSGEPR